MKVSVILASALLVASSALSQDIVKVATDAGLTTLLDVVKLANLVGPLTDGKANLTVLAPSNQAFTDLGEKTLAIVTAPYNKDLLKDILLFHVFADRYPSAVLLGSNGQNSPPTLEGSTHTITVQNNNIFVDGARVVTPNVAFYNGRKLSVVHVINKVLVPQSVKLPTSTITELVTALNNDGQFTFLFKALGEYGTELTDLLNSSTNKGFTVFAPTDSAWKQLPIRFRTFPIKQKCRKSLLKILKFHVVPRGIRAGGLNGRLTSLAGKTIDVDRRGQAVFVDDAKIVNANIRATNGIIHVINEVMLPW